MAYPYYSSYPMGLYQPMQNMGNQFQPMQMNQAPAPQAVQAPQSPQQPNSGIIWCQGEEGAKGYLVAPGNSVLLMDSEGNHFYLKSTDAQGMPLPLRIFDYVERTSQRQAAQAASAPSEEYVTRKEFDALAARLDAMTSSKPSSKRTSAKEGAENGESTI